MVLVGEGLRRRGRGRQQRERVWGGSGLAVGELCLVREGVGG